MLDVEVSITPVKTIFGQRNRFNLYMFGQYVMSAYKLNEIDKYIKESRV